MLTLQLSVIRVLRSRHAACEALRRLPRARGRSGMALIDSFRHSQRCAKSRHARPSWARCPRPLQSRNGHTRRHRRQPWNTHQPTWSPAL